MKVMNRGVQPINVVLADGAKCIHKGETAEMPEWVFRTLVRVFPGLVVVQEEPKQVIVNAEPAPVEKPQAEAKNVKGKKSRK